MSAMSNQDVLRRVIEEGFNKGNTDALDTLFAPEYKERQFGLGRDLAGFKQDIQAVRTGFPDFHLTIEDMVEAGDRVWMRMTARGTNHGPFMGPPTGKSISITVFDECRFENHQIVEHWGVPDRFAIMAQLGLIPQPEALQQ